MIRLLELEVEKLKKKHPNMIIIWGICLKILPKFKKLNYLKKNQLGFTKKISQIFLTKSKFLL